MDWKPIETGPQNGSWVLGYGRACGSGGSAVALVRWEWNEYPKREIVRRDLFESGAVKTEYWDDVQRGQGYWTGEVSPTHWMPLPQPPTK